MAAPGLALTPADRALRALLPIAAGATLESARDLIADHLNPKRARLHLFRGMPAIDLRATAIQACGRLARRVAPASQDVDNMLSEALTSNEPEVIRMARFQ